MNPKGHERRGINLSTAGSPYSRVTIFPNFSLHGWRLEFSKTSKSTPFTQGFKF